MGAQAGARPRQTEMNLGRGEGAEADHDAAMPGGDCLKKTHERGTRMGDGGHQQMKRCSWWSTVDAPGLPPYRSMLQQPVMVSTETADV
jgi:hypothetical protein